MARELRDGGTKIQLSLFQQGKDGEGLGLDASLWHGSFNSRESTLHQLSPYVGKMKSGMARVLISLFSNEGDVVLDPYNRLRLWFLGCKDWKALDDELTANNKVYQSQMKVCLKEMHRVLKSGSYCVLVLGDVERDGQIRRTAEVLADMAVEVTGDGFSVEEIYDDRIPDKRRSRRQTKTTKFERILVMRKV